MRKHLFLPCLVLLCIGLSCKRQEFTPRPAVASVYAIAADSSGLGRLVANAGSCGADGSIAIIGEPADVITLARRFQSCDRRDNIDGKYKRDSLPDFAGENFDVIMDAYNSPYAHFLQSARDLSDSLSRQVLDSLREAAVQNALFAWDSTCLRTSTDLESRMFKQQAKILIFTSSIQAEWGFFDVDTLQTLTGGHSFLLCPMELMLQDAYDAGARHIVVWTTRDVRLSAAWERVFARSPYKDATLTVLSPESALDVRTEFRNLLRQYRSSSLPMDALILDSYFADAAPLQSELKMIRRAATEEDAAFDKFLSPSFFILDPESSVIDHTYSLLRRERLFTQRIAHPAS